jgi:hypothetical protein
MRRYEGFLRRSDAEPLWPSRWWIVAVELSVEPAPARWPVRTSRLAGWSAAILDCDGPRCVARELRRGRTAGEFWDCFLAQRRIKGSTYVISPRALMAWQVLGLWEMVETGNLRVQANGSSVPGSGGSRQTCGSVGPLLTGDPPTGGIFRHDDSQLSFTWVCAGNYGLQPLSAGTDSAGESSQLALAVESATAVLDRYRLGGWALTAGAMALRGWRSDYDGRPLYVSSGRGGDPLELSAVAGGLLLARPTGDAPVQAVSVDARSMYPYLCACYPQATNLRRRGLGGMEASAVVGRAPAAVLARVEVETMWPMYPQRTERGVVYPTGKFVTTLCGPELEEALRRGHVRSIICCNEYELGLPTTTYQRRVYAAREACEETEYRAAGNLIKRLGVSLVGKLLQRVEIWRECMPDISDPLWGTWDHYEWDGTRRRYQARAGMTEVCTGTELASHSIPSIPLWVWSWGRLRMRRWMEAAGPDTVYYADTDGLLLSPGGFERLQTQGLLSDGSWGLLRHVSGPDTCVVRGPKDFTMGDRVVCAGSPKNQRQAGSQIGESAWYRLPWDQLGAPEWEGSWVERMR